MTILSTPRPVLLCILDGWGCSDQTADNAIALARKPVWDRLMRTSPNGVADASERHVGLPSGQMGNSEVGHMNLGAGRVAVPELPRIDKAVRDASQTRMSDPLKFISRASDCISSSPSPRASSRS